jgi:hypothetical protein
VPQSPEDPPTRPLPHRAFDLKTVKEYNKAILTDFMEHHLEGPNAFPKWDTHAIEAWDKKVRTRGKCLCWLQKRIDKLAEDLHLMQLNHPYRATTRDYWEQYCKALNIAVAKDMAMRKEATETKESLTRTF